MIYGFTGWGLEILWTGFMSFMEGDYRLKSTTSIWMFFIYGLAVLLEPVSNTMVGLPLLLRGCIYVCCIFLMEYLSGWIMRKMDVCPWHYDRPRNISGLIRLDYAPLWFAAGLFYEYLYLNILK